MLIFLLAYLGGVLTIASPCILPVLPFVFARGDQPFLRSGLPLLAGMALTFALVASLAAVGGGWAVQASQFGRLAALVLMGAFGLLLIFPSWASWATRPLVAWGARLSALASRDAAGAGGGSIVPSLLLGVSTGLLWAPCAGPILGLLLTAAALNGASAQTTVLLLAYAAGAATSLAAALWVGGTLFKVMGRSLGAGEWIRRGIGVALLCGVAAIALGLDTGLLARISLSGGTSSLEQALVDQVRPTARANTGDLMAPNAPGMAMSGSSAMMAAAPRDNSLPIEGQMPALTGAVQWLNSEPLTPEQLRGKVVLVDFWTYSCINCLRALPYVKAWAAKYRDQGLVVIGVHTPEFAFEKDIDNVRKAARELGVDYPVAVDNNYAVWRAFNNQYWPAHYFVDAQGRIRHHHFGEGEYSQSEQVIRRLLAEAGSLGSADVPIQISAGGAQAAADGANLKSPETYLGYGRAENFASPGGFVRDQQGTYRAPDRLQLNQWAFSGDWRVSDQSAVATRPEGRIAYQFHARDLHLVLGPGADGKPVRFRVLLDGKPPGESHGMDVDAQGNGTLVDQRLYQLIRQRGVIGPHRFEIEFLDPGAQAYAFTFG